MAKKMNAIRLTKPQLLERNVALADTVGLLEENIAELELALDDEGWQRMDFTSRFEFSQEGLATIIRRARLMYIKNPLVNRAVEVMRYYVFAQGVTIQARDDALNARVQAFLEDPSNLEELTSHEARGLKEVAFGTDGGFVLLFITGTDGRVQLRSIPIEEVLAGGIIKNPEDRRDVWYYKRVWTRVETDIETGDRRTEVRTDYYPHWRYRPESRPQRIGKDEIHWDMPAYHVKVGGTDGMSFGVPEVYAALDWAKAVKGDLEDYATLKKALSRFAFDLTIKGGAKQVKASRDALETTYPATGTDSNPPPPAGAWWIANESAKLNVVKTAGAQPSPEEGRALRLMVAAATGLPETILMGDADVGNLATAKTLDRPTELKVRDRQTLWSTVFRNVVSFALQLADEQGAKNTPAAPAPELASDGTQKPKKDVSIEVIWPPILEHDPEEYVKSLVSGATLDGKTFANTIPPKAFVQKLLAHFEVENIDEVLAEMFPNDENAVLSWEPAPSPEEQLQMKADAAARGGGPPARASEEAFRRLGDALEKIVERQIERRRGAA